MLHHLLEGAERDATVRALVGGSTWGEGGVEGIPEKLFSETSPEFPRIFRENSGIFPGIQSSLLKSPEISVNPESNRIHVLLY